VRLSSLPASGRHRTRPAAKTLARDEFDIEVLVQAILGWTGDHQYSRRLAIPARVSHFGLVGILLDFAMHTTLFSACCCRLQC